MKRAIIAIGLAGTLLTGIAFGQSQGDIPGWIKATAGFWVDDTITDDEFLQAISYLIEEGVIKVEPNRSCYDIMSDAKSYMYAYLGASLFEDDDNSRLRTSAATQQFVSILHIGTSLDDWANQGCDTEPDTEEYMRDEIFVAQQTYDRIIDTDTTPSAQPPADDTDRTVSPYSIEIVRCANTAGYVETEAFITNLEDVPRTYVVTFTLLDAAGKPITFENGYAFDVPPGAERPVEAIFFEDVRFDSCEATVAII